MLQKFVKSNGGGGSGAPRSSALSVIGPDVKIVGNIITQGEMQIDGQVEGDITCHTLVVGEGARITGEVTAEAVRVHGDLSGKIDAVTIVIAKTASVSGDVIHETLEIEAGANLEGHILRRNGTAKPAAPALEHKPANKANGTSQPAEEAKVPA